MIMKAANDKRLEFMGIYSPMRLAALTWNQKSANFIVASGEGIVDPAAADEEAPLVVVVDVGQRSEAVHPEAEPVELGAGDAVVAHQPARR